MASLTDTIPTENYVKPVISTKERSPDYLGGIANVGRGIADVFEIKRQRKSNEEAALRAARSDQREEYRFQREVGAQNVRNELAQRAFDIYGQPELDQANPNDPLVNGLNTSGLNTPAFAGLLEEVETLGRARDAGAVSGTDYNIRAKAAVAAMLNEYPDYADEIMTYLDDVGLDTLVHRERLYEQKMHEAQRDADVAAYKLNAEAVSKAGINTDGWSDDQIQLVGRDLVRSDYETSLLRAQIDQEIKLSTENREINKAKLAQDYKTIADNTMNVYSTQTLPIVQDFIKLATLSADDQTAQDYLASFAPDALAKLKLLRMQALSTNSFLPPEEMKRLEEHFDLTEKTLNDMVAGDVTRGKIMAQQIETLAMSGKIWGHKYVPELMRFKEVFGPQAMAAFIEKAVYLDPVAKDQMEKQVSKGVLDVLNGVQSHEADEVNLRMDRFQKTTNAPEIEYAKLKPEEQRQVIQQSKKSVEAYSKALVENPDDAEALKYFNDSAITLSHAFGVTPSNTASGEKYLSSLESALATPQFKQALAIVEQKSPKAAAIIRENVSTSYGVAVRSLARVALKEQTLAQQGVQDFATVYADGVAVVVPQVGVDATSTIVFDSKSGSYMLKNDKTGELRPMEGKKAEKLNRAASIWAEAELTSNGKVAELFKNDVGRMKNFLVAGEMDKYLEGKIQEQMGKYSQAETADPTLDRGSGDTSIMTAINKYGLTLRDSIIGTSNGAFMGSGQTLERVKQMIDNTEGGGDYNALLGFSNKTHFANSKPVSEMSFGELKKFAAPDGEYAQYSREWTGKNENNPRMATPMGRYQFVGKTLFDLQARLGISDDTIFSPEMQDTLFEHLWNETLMSGRNPADVWVGLRRYPEFGGKTKE